MKKIKKISSEIIGYMCTLLMVSAYCFMNLNIVANFFLDTNYLLISVPNLCKYAIKAMISLLAGT